MARKSDGAISSGSEDSTFRRSELAGRSVDARLLTGRMLTGLTVISGLTMVREGHRGTMCERGRSPAHFVNGSARLPSSLARQGLAVSDLL